MPRTRLRILCTTVLAVGAVATPALADTAARRTSPGTGVRPATVRAATGRAATDRAATVRAATGKTPVATVYPTAGSHAFEPTTEIAFRGIPSALVKNITVTGSRSGRHAGRIGADSDGSGASFIPAKAFAAGEKVTVKAPFSVLGGKADSYSFTVATPAVVKPPAYTGAPVATPVQTESYPSDASVTPPVVTTTNAATAFPGDLFTTPFIKNVSGVQISDPNGRVLFYQPAPAGQLDYNIRRSTYLGEPVITFWQGKVFAGGYTYGQYVIMNQHYKVIAKVPGSSGLGADAHDLELTPQGFAYLTNYNPVIVDARSSKGSAKQIVLDGVVQEVDVATGRVVFEWHSLDHVGLGATYTPVDVIWDYVHINSVEPYANDSILVSLRATNAVYVIKRSTGAVTQVIGGRYSTVKEPAAAMTNSQHDAEPHPGGIITVFDNGAGVESGHGTLSRALVLHVTGNTVTLVRELDAPQGQLSSAMGNVQMLSTGYLVDFGLAGFVVLYDLNGNVVRQFNYQPGGLSYRAFVDSWQGTPDTTPGVSVSTDQGVSTTSVSWNGATGVASWRIMSGPSSANLSPVTTFAATGFESVISTPALTGTVVVQALDGSGKVMGASLPITF